MIPLPSDSVTIIEWFRYHEWNLDILDIDKQTL